jgi:hypothetical protein
MRKAGKKIQNTIYVHKDYEKTLDFANKEISKAKKILGSKLKKYTAIRVNIKSKDIAFIYSPNFDIADEPIVGKSILVKFDGSVTITPQRKNPQIWHHKWMWVEDDYKGFDVEESKKRSELWNDKVSKEERRKIGYKSFWDKIRKRWDK